MRTRTLGARGPEISVIGYGAWELGGAWGSNPPEAEMIAAMRAGFDAGITWIDTAEAYGDGISEELVARALAGHDDVLVFTKVAPKPAGSGFRPDQVRAACEASIKRLSRDRIDVYQLHWRDNDVPVEDTWGAMASLVDEGRARWIGVSNFDRALIERCQRVRHVDSLQPQFSMLARQHAELVGWCEENGTGTVCYGPLAYGLLTGTITEETTFEDTDWRSGKMGMGNYERLFAPAARVTHLRVVDALRPIAAGRGITLAQLALAWVLHQPGATAAIAGSRRVSHTTDNAAAGDIHFTDDDLTEIERVLDSR